MIYHPKDHSLPAAQQSAELAAAEAKYCLTAFDLAAAPLGSRDWTLYWRGWHDRSRVPLCAGNVPSQITVDFKQARELLELFGGEPGEIALMRGPGHSGDGLYAVYIADPDGAVYLGETDEEAVAETTTGAAQASSQHFPDLEPTAAMVKAMVFAWLTQPPGRSWDDCAIAGWKAGCEARDGCHAPAKAAPSHDARDAARYREFCDGGLTITFNGEDYHSKCDLDAAIDAVIEAGTQAPRGRS